MHWNDWPLRYGVDVVVERRRLRRHLSSSLTSSNKFIMTASLTKSAAQCAFRVLDYSTIYMVSESREIELILSLFQVDEQGRKSVATSGAPHQTRASVADDGHAI